MIVGISGYSKSGKDTVADILVDKYAFAKVALADPIKRFAAQMYGFSYRQLWGPSECRNEVDPRYGFSPRMILQKLGTEFGRHFWEDVWVDYAIRIVKALTTPLPVNMGGFVYYCDQGLSWSDDPPPIEGVVIPDVRFRNEAERINAEGGAVVGVTRPGSGLQGEAGEHLSEVSIGEIPYRLINRTINNDSSIRDLEFAVADFYSEVIAKN